MERGVVSETPNLAARLQAIAKPDTTVVALGTRRLVANLFEYQVLGAIAAKGFNEPVHAFEVLRKSGVESRFQAFPVRLELALREDARIHPLALSDLARSRLFHRA